MCDLAKECRGCAHYRPGPEVSVGACARRVSAALSVMTGAVDDGDLSKVAARAAVAWDGSCGRWALRPERGGHRDGLRGLQG